jgi:hypothetical protein
MRRANFGLRPQNLAVFALRIFHQNGCRAFSLVAGAAQRGNFGGRGDTIRLRVTLRRSMPKAFAVTGIALYPGLRVRVGEEILHGVAMADRAQFMLLRGGRGSGRKQQDPQRSQPAIRNTIHPLIA